MCRGTGVYKRRGGRTDGRIQGNCPRSPSGYKCTNKAPGGGGSPYSIKLHLSTSKSENTSRTGGMWQASKRQLVSQSVSQADRNIVGQGGEPLWRGDSVFLGKGGRWGPGRNIRCSGSSRALTSRATVWRRRRRWRGDREEVEMVTEEGHCRGWGKVAPIYHRHGA